MLCGWVHVGGLEPVTLTRIAQAVCWLWVGKGVDAAESVRYERAAGTAALLCHQCSTTRRGHIRVTDSPIHPGPTRPAVDTARSPPNSARHSPARVGRSRTVLRRLSTAWFTAPRHSTKRMVTCERCCWRLPKRFEIVGFCAIFGRLRIQKDPNGLENPGKRGKSSGNLAKTVGV